MIDIFVVNSNNKFYSVKTRLEKINDTKDIKMYILSITEVKNVVGTTFTRLKTIFDIDNGDHFSKNAYSNIVNLVSEKIFKKYGIKNIQCQI